MGHQYVPNISLPVQPSNDSSLYVNGNMHFLFGSGLDLEISGSVLQSEKNDRRITYTEFVRFCTLKCNFRKQYHQEYQPVSFCLPNDNIVLSLVEETIKAYIKRIKTRVFEFS